MSLLVGLLDPLTTNMRNQDDRSSQIMQGLNVVVVVVVVVVITRHIAGGTKPAVIKTVRFSKKVMIRAFSVLSGIVIKWGRKQGGKPS